MSTVLITGASRGIGAACAYAFGKAGYDVAVNYNRSEERAETVAEELRTLGVRSCAVRADVSDSSQVKAMFDKVRSELGAVDVLVNNAGIAMYGLLTDMSDSDWDRMISSDLSSVFYCCRAALPDMIRAHSGAIRSLVRGGVFCRQGGSHRADQGARQGGRALGHTRQRRITRCGHDRYDVGLYG